VSSMQVWFYFVDHRLKG